MCICRDVVMWDGLTEELVISTSYSLVANEDKPLIAPQVWTWDDRI